MAHENNSLDSVAFNQSFNCYFQNHNPSTKPRVLRCEIALPGIIGNELYLVGDQLSESVIHLNFINTTRFPPRNLSRSVELLKCFLKKHSSDATSIALVYSLLKFIKSKRSAKKSDEGDPRAFHVIRLFNVCEHFCFYIAYDNIPLAEQVVTSTVAKSHLGVVHSFCSGMTGGIEGWLSLVPTR